MYRFIAALSVGIIIAVFCVGAAFAADDAQLEQILKRTETLEKENDALKERVDMLEKAQKQSPAPSTSTTLSPVLPDVDGTGFFVSAD